jgi:hypothetical protein
VSDGFTRRKLLASAAGVAVGGAAVGVALEAAGGGSASADTVRLGPQPAGLPARQHAWTATLARDDDGNPIAPRFDRLLFYDLQGTPTAANARALEAVLRALERAYPWGPQGLLFTAGWGPGYFERGLAVASPIERPEALSSFELPTLDDYDLCLHLACDDEVRIAAVEAALVSGTRLPGIRGSLELGASAGLRWRERRTGFVGAGLPARHQDVGGIPPGNPVPASSPLFMGFKSGLRKNQATEDYVTIAGGPFAGGTTMQVSYMRLRLDSWYGSLDQSGRVARMYAPEITPAQVDRFTTDAESDPRLLGQATTRYGVIGHAQTSARARRGGKPLIIRRDFNTVDGGEAGLHFVSVQRSIKDFITTRSAMNASHATIVNPSITDTINNGINEFILVLRRANYILPTRAERSYPLLPGRSFS